MGDHSAIEWTEATWNPTTGCDRTSPGCDNCYAMTLSKRLKAMGQAKYQNDGDPRTSGPGFGLTLHPDTLDVPRSWAAPRVIFVNSMSDLFHKDVPISYIRQVFEVIADTPQHQYQVLTKRSKRLADVGSRLDWPPNLWMGVSVESSKYRFRLDHLRQVGAAVRFVSAEPLLGPLHDLDLDGIHWLIAGGESGAHALDRWTPPGLSISATSATTRACRSSSSSGAVTRRRPAVANSTAEPTTRCQAATSPSHDRSSQGLGLVVRAQTAASSPTTCRALRARSAEDRATPSASICSPAASTTTGVTVTEASRGRHDRAQHGPTVHEARVLRTGWPGGAAPDRHRRSTTQRRPLASVRRRLQRHASVGARVARSRALGADLRIPRSTRLAGRLVNGRDAGGMAKGQAYEGRTVDSHAGTGALTRVLGFAA